MVQLAAVHASNKRAAAELPAGIVVVAAGATAGIGRYHLEALWAALEAPRIYLIGRSQKAADDIRATLQRIKPDNFTNGGKLEFLQADLSVIKNVDDVCARIPEEHINVLFMSQGVMPFGAGETSDGIPLALALLLHSRLRMIDVLLPRLRSAPHLRRVVSVAAGTKEGPVSEDDILGRNVPVTKARGHMVSAQTLMFEHYARVAPEVSLVQSYPGFVDTDFVARLGLGWRVLQAVISTGARLFGGRVGRDECGARHVFLSTSAVFAPARDAGAGAGVARPDGVPVAVGSDGAPGSGVYTVDERCEPGNAKVLAVLKTERERGVPAALEKHFSSEFERCAAK